MAIYVCLKAHSQTLSEDVCENICRKCPLYHGIDHAHHRTLNHYHLSNSNRTIWIYYSLDYENDPDGGESHNKKCPVCNRQSILMRKIKKDEI